MVAEPAETAETRVPAKFVAGRLFGGGAKAEETGGESVAAVVGAEEERAEAVDQEIEGGAEVDYLVAGAEGDGEVVIAADGAGEENQAAHADGGSELAQGFEGDEAAGRVGDEVDGGVGVGGAVGGETGGEALGADLVAALGEEVGEEEGGSPGRGPGEKFNSGGFGRLTAGGRGGEMGSEEEAAVAPFETEPGERLDEEDQAAGGIAGWRVVQGGAVAGELNGPDGDQCGEDPEADEEAVMDENSVGDGCEKGGGQEKGDET